MNDTSRESLSILTNYIVKLLACGPRVEIHRQVILFCQSEMWFESFELTCLISKLKSIIVKAALANSDYFSGSCLFNKLINLYEVFI